MTHVTFGDAYPIFTNARVRPADDTGRMVSLQRFVEKKSYSHIEFANNYSESKWTLTIPTAFRCLLKQNWSLIFQDLDLQSCPSPWV